MKMRAKLKQAKRQNERYRAGEAYLFGVCERTRAELEQLREAREAERAVTMLLLTGCVIAAGGKITLQTENMQRVMEEKRLQFDADAERHTVTLCVTEKEKA